MKNQFSPSEAAVSIFEFIKVHPKFVLKFCAVYAVISFICIILMMNSGFKDVMIAFSKPDFDPTNPNMVLQAYKNIKIEMILPIFIISTLMGVMANTMALRKTVLNQETGLFGLNFGKDEIQYLKASLFIFLLYFVYFFIIVLLSTLVASIPAISLIFATGGICFGVYLYFKFSMYGVYVIANKTIGLKESLAATKEDFWSYVGAFILCSVIIMIGSMVVMGIIGSILGTGQVQDFEKITNINEVIQQMFSIKNLIYYTINGLISGFTQLALICTGSYIYHRTRPEEGQNIDIKI